MATLRISDEVAGLLAQQASAHGLSLEDYMAHLARQSRETVSSTGTRTEQTRKAAEKLARLRGQVQPDPEGWTVGEYVRSGRR